MSTTGKLWRLINDPQVQNPAAAGLRAVAWALSWGYGLGAAAQQLSYDLGWRKVVKLPVPVIGIGNLVAGGTGKTPLVIKVAETLLSAGLPVAVVSRGHGRQNNDAVLWVSKGQGPLLSARQSGDEPYLLSQRLAVPVLVGADRVKVARALLSAMGPHIIIGDDLFQHRRLWRDLDIVALDATAPLGNGHLLPRGPLREPASALRRAQVVVLTRGDDQSMVQNSKTWLRAFWGSGPVLSCQHRITGLQTWPGALPLEYNGGGVMAFCGLATPRAFQHSLQSLGVKALGLTAFDDHHWFTPADLAGLEREATRLGAQALLTSEKDAVRLPAAWRPSLPVYTTRLDLQFAENSLPRVLTWGLAANIKRL